MINALYMKTSAKRASGQGDVTTRIAASEIIELLLMCLAGFSEALTFYPQSYAIYIKVGCC